MINSLTVMFKFYSNCSANNYFYFNTDLHYVDSVFTMAYEEERVCFHWVSASVTHIIPLVMLILL